MSVSTHVSHCRRCVSLTRQFTDSAAGKDTESNVTNWTQRLLNSVNALHKSRMSMQNQWKLLTQLKDYLNKATDDRNMHSILSKDWLSSLQKATSTQIENIRKISLADNDKSNDSVKNVPVDKDNANVEKSVAVALENHKESRTESPTHPTIQQKSTGQEISELKQEIKDHSHSVAQAFAALILKVTSRNRDTRLSAMPKWKINVQSNIPKHSIVSRTRHVLNSIATAESTASKWRRVEDLLIHIDQYPDARHYAIKEGAISILLRARQKTKDEQVQASIREALAVLGHVDPLPGRGIRILSIDGGGIRGVLVIEMLKKLEELTGKRTHEMFDYICGVSTGAILAGVLGGHKRKSLSEISELYKELSTRVFTQSALKGTSGLVWSHAYYDTALWEKLLQEQLGDRVLIKTSRDANAPKFATVSTVANHARVMSYVFRNYTLPYRVESQYIGSHKHKLWEAVRASAAAPSYFEEFKCGDFLHQDGGISVNNPCAVALHEAKQLWPNCPIQCVISFGTGRVPVKVGDTGTESIQVAAISSWKDKFFKILDSATDTEAVHTMLNDLLPDHIYYRFNPYLTEMLTMVEIRPEKISQLEQDAKMYIRRNEEKFQKAAAALMEERKLQQKFADWAIIQKQLWGL